MPKHQRLHLAVQFLAVSLVIFAIQDLAIRQQSVARSILPDPRESWIGDQKLIDDMAGRVFVK